LHGDAIAASSARPATSFTVIAAHRPEKRATASLIET
jgi:hypothetical protein